MMASSPFLGPKRPFVKTIIIGAGFSGLAMGCKLKAVAKSDDFVIYDQADGAGGTWWANKYPGCGVDIPAVLYSLSFAPNPSFSRLFPKQKEILQYFNDVADRFDVTRHFCFNIRWERAYWQDESSTWLVEMKDLTSGQAFQHECSVLISAVGGVSIPNIPKLQGMDGFEGDIVHTARWKDDLALKNKDVVVIGNGSSASQLIPTIIKDAKSVTQFIRTPQHYMKSQDRAVGSLWTLLFRFVPGLLRLIRAATFLYLETSHAQFNLTRYGAEMRAKSLQLSDLYVRMTAPVKYWGLLTPAHDLGCKRRVFDNDNYLECLNRDNIHLTDDPIIAIEPRSVLTNSGLSYPADTIVFATGFSLSQFDSLLVGRYGYTREMHRKTYGTVEAFKTVAMAGFPNFFYILGPHSGKGHTSTLYAAENFVDLILRVTKPIFEGKASSVEVKFAAEQRFHFEIQGALKNTVFTGLCNSWYIDGKTGKNWFIYPWNSLILWFSTHFGGGSDWTYNYNTRTKANGFHFGILSVSTTVTILLLGRILLALVGTNKT
ncbi:hypothetical protein ASPZODRAFT_1104154 [Penicilliopsis zonata CBS 506.65]|uniref:Uncharacterized protein n=1 Tax=Penicilliopsis zonata CBS 506.65 TaxID=1073090 RepID=A0A1L9SSL0_9EURO|nr:hypothetical protein ASPZODRAFT_1104154 [Penicilliopsis zonata CBS 506.65]OJJ50091.1 hypothetical protein ASPZODRAFT_1104154 [Penicilliopsis zonata CBS 506.65]